MEDNNNPKQAQNPLSEQQMLDMVFGAKGIERGEPTYIEVRGKKWKLRPVSQRQMAKISNLAFEMLYLQRKAKEELTLRQMKRINEKMRQIPAKQAAHYVLGRWLWLVPFLWSITWRRIYNSVEDVSSLINTTKTLMGKEKDFYIANLEVQKVLLALSMRQVGEAAKQKREREESAEGMLEQDASPKKEEDSK